LCGEVAASCPLCGASNGSRPSWRLTVENLFSFPHPILKH
jgi:hypothetical protein